MPGPYNRETLASFFAAFRAEEAIKDAKNSTSYKAEFECLARQLSDKMTYDELFAYVKERWNEEKQKLTRKKAKKSKPAGPKCPDCYVLPGSIHSPGCDIETCPACGLQRLSCGCSTSLPPVPWEGENVMARDAKRNNLYAKLNPKGPGWIPCSKDDPNATPDLNVVPIALKWNKAEQRWEPKA